MLRNLRPRLSFANVTSVLALFVALGGTSAVALSGSNTVFSDDIANDNFNSPTEGQGGLVASDLRAGSVTGSEVADSSLTGTDVFNNTISGADITNGSLTGADVFDNTIVGADVTNHSLTGADIGFAQIDSTHINEGTLDDDDISERAWVNFTAQIPAVPAFRCRDAFIQGVGGLDGGVNDHVVVTPNNEDHFLGLFYTARHSAVTATGEDAIAIQACNLSEFNIAANTRRLNLLVIEDDQPTQ